MIVIRSEAHLARVLRRRRERYGLSQRALAARMYVGFTTLAKRERGERGCPFGAAVKHAKALGYAVALVPLERTEEAA